MENNLNQYDHCSRTLVDSWRPAVNEGQDFTRYKETKENSQVGEQ